MLEVTDLPALNATLNGLSGVLLLAGFLFIRQGARDAHKRCMLGAMVSSTLFLVSYLVYHYHVGSRPFPGMGLVRSLYFFILVTHVVLAVGVVPLAIVSTARGLSGQFARHRAIVKWTFPLWLYVSVTGVVIYLMLYKLY